MKPDLTVEQVATMLNVNIDDVYGYIKSGELQAWNKTHNAKTIRPKYRIPAEALERFRRNRMVVPEPEEPKPRRRIRVPDHV